MNENKVISFSLWGNNEKYTVGAINNAIIAKTIYPDWQLRMYTRYDVPESIQKELINLDVELILMPNNDEKWNGLFWRFNVADDVNIDRFIVRDTDSILNRKEKSAVDDWIKSDVLFHIMRDNPSHNRPILGGMWGSKGKVWGGMEKSYSSFCKNKKINDRGPDQEFLQLCIWPLIQKHHIAHDHYFGYSGSQSRHFPKILDQPKHFPPYVGAVCVDWYKKLEEEGFDWKKMLLNDGLRIPNV